MQKSAIILTKDAVLGQYIRLCLGHRVPRILVTDSLPDATDCRYLIVDLDTVSMPEAIGEKVLLCAMEKEKPLGCPHLWLDRPFRPERLLAALGLGEDKQALPMYPLSERKSVMVDGVEVPLSEKEYALFMALFQADGYVSRERLLEAVWGNPEEASRLNVYIHYLRKKLTRNGRDPIEVSRGKGYRLKKGEEIC